MPGAFAASRQKKKIVSRFFKKVKQLTPDVDYCSFRFVNRYSNIITVTRGIAEPVVMAEDDGVMVTVYNNGGIGYGATSNLTEDGISDAVNQALDWASFSKNKISTKNLSTLLSIIYKKPKKFFYSQAIKFFK